jgi:hypothetical protein
MPTLISLYDKFKDNGLAIICVHVDLDGEVTTAATLEHKLASIRQSYWKGRELPFPVALTSGRFLDLPSGEIQRGGAAAEYGVQFFPTAFLIDPSGKMEGNIDLSDEKEAFANVAKMLANIPAGGRSATRP